MLRIQTPSYIHTEPSEKIRNSEPNYLNITKVVELTQKLEELLCREENLWRQKSREIWLQEGEKNNKIFHSNTIRRRKMNKIEKIKNDKGEWLPFREEIGKKLCKNLTNVLTSDTNRDLSIIKDLIRPCISQEDNEQFINILLMKK